jgi:hypothetical protein
VKDALVINLASTDQKHKLMRFIGTLPAGLYDVLIKPHKKTRSLDQNAYYWTAYIQGWTEWLREASGEPWISKEQAHEALKKHVLGTTPIVNKQTGEVIDEMIPDSRFMDTKEFSEYLDRAAKFLAEFAEIVVIPSDLYYEMKQPKKGKTGGTVTDIRQAR